MIKPSQYAVIKADILADNTLNSFPLTSDGSQSIADLYNQLASPAFIVWRTKLSESEIVSTTLADTTTWSWPAFILRSANEISAWARMFATGYINPSLSQVRQGIADIFSNGPVGAAAQRNFLLSISKRSATRIEKLLATGTGSTASPATLDFEGFVNYQDIDSARNS